VQSPPGRLLLIGLPLTIGAGFLLARGLYPEIGVWLALLIAAALAPTDAGLGAATVLNPVVPARVRRILNVESGLNDGLATPVVLFAVAAAAGLADDDSGHGVLEAVLELMIGAVVGVVVGYLAGRLIDRSRGRGWADRGLLPIATLAVPLLCYYGAPLGSAAMVSSLPSWLEPQPLRARQEWMTSTKAWFSPG
jgi:NhaP-type Na+/H+ or K+/H+ antiporter